MTTTDAPPSRPVADERVASVGLLKRLLVKPELGALVGAVVVFAFIVQQNLIASANARYDTLFNAYQEVTRDCEDAADCTTDAPPPEDVPQPVAGAAGEPGVAGERGPRGLEGPQGEAGKDGVNGADGAPGSPGTAGADGADGAPGAPGANGIDGTPGQPPYSWTFTDPLGLAYTCNRTDPFDQTAPTYSCAPTP